MSDEQEAGFPLLETGVPNLDIVLGGGLPVGSFNLIAGGPGAGKTILSQQIMFHNAGPERQVLHFTVLGEPVAKLLRYQRRMAFFDQAKVNTTIRFIDIGDVIRKEGLERGLELIVSRVERYSPAVVVVDSVRAVREIARREGDYGLRSFTHDLSQVAVVWNATSFMVGEYEESELRAGPEFTMADGIIWLTMDQAANSVVRKLQVVKSRGMNIVQGLHSFRIDRNGIYVYPRVAPTARLSRTRPQDRAPFGVPGLDGMMGGGIPRGQGCLIAGTTGTGKSVLAQHFIAEGIQEGEPTVAAIFEETPGEYAARAKGFGWDFDRWEQEGRLAIVYRGAMDLTVDEVIDETRLAATRIGAGRVVIDSISGFELARAPADRSIFREGLYRMVAAFTSDVITVLMTSEIPEVFGDLRFSAHGISFIADNIILLRYTEIESELRKVLAVVKMRSANHGKDLRQFEITDRGVVVGAAYRAYTGVLSGVPSPVTIVGPQPFAPGLEPRERVVVEALFNRGVATAEHLAADTGFERAEIDRTLAELVGRGFVVRERGDGETYHVAMVSWTPGAGPAGRGRTRRGGGQDDGEE
ncbi:MAG: protein kinase [Chloroflexi bacterium]|nr:protein kinase [Chloroflexota bacterium]